MFDKEKALEVFDNFLMIMDGQLDALENDGLEKGIELDFSLDSLDKLEKLFVLMAEGADKDTTNSLIVYFGRYLGEIVRTNYGGKWHLPLDDPKNINFNRPVVIGHSPIEGLEFAPLSVVRAFSLRRKKGLFRGAIDAQVNPKPLDLSKYEIEEAPDE